MRCLPFTHDWKRRYRPMSNAMRRDLLSRVSPALVFWPWLFPAIEYIGEAKWWPVGRQCRRCGKQVKE